MSGQAEILDEFLISSFRGEVIHSGNPIMKIVPMPYCKTPEENESLIYWRMIKKEVDPLIIQLITIHKEYPINIVYVGDYDKRPSTLFQHIDASFKANDFHVGNTPNNIYEWFICFETSVLRA